MFVIGLGAGVVGVAVGAAAGYFRGMVDSVLLKVIEVMMIMPSVVVGAMLGKAAGDKGTTAPVLGGALALLFWVTMARLIRGEFFALREREFVDASRLAGASAFRVIFKHMLPNAVGVIVVQTTLLMSESMLMETALSYLGFGIKYPETSLGALISEYKDAIGQRPWLFWWPGVFMITIALCVNYLGDGLRDAFDPRQKRIPSRRRMAKAGEAA
jgi:peptide/nickel transport system permease protein